MTEHNDYSIHGKKGFHLSALCLDCGHEYYPLYESTICPQCESIRKTPKLTAYKNPCKRCGKDLSPLEIAMAEDLGKTGFCSECW